MKARLVGEAGRHKSLFGRVRAWLALAEQAGAVKGVYGARMTGGGFGGCIVALAQPRSADALAEHLKRAYGEQFGIDPTVFATTATGGAGVIE